MLSGRGDFETNNRDDERGDEEEAPKGGRLMKHKDTQEHGTQRADACPHGVCRAHRYAFDGLCEQYDAGHIEDNQANEPAHKGSALRDIHLAETEGKGHFAQSGEDK